ncbi:MAG: MptD family putative ECF transporter S component [Peptococcaceae bacterium]|nr:MptD family putative ECF transporter S component [Peptococcaceae bacterium]
MNKLQGKDLINVGIFTALYFVVLMAIAMLGFIPIFLPLLIVLVPIVGGIVMMLYYSKIHCFGMLSLTGLITGILMLLTGMGYWSIATGLVFGVLADLVLKSGGYKSARKGVFSHGVFSMWLIGNYMPLVLTRNSYYQQLVTKNGQDYADAAMHYISAGSLPVLLIAGFICGCIGGVIGQKVFKKHFQRAGIA